MKNKNIVIIGGGFAGISALRRLRRYKSRLDSDFRVVLIDKKKDFEFLPMLPDLIGERISPEALKVDLKGFCEKLGCSFLEAEVKSVDLGSKTIFHTRGELEYEYLIVASGSETNFFDNNDLASSCSKLDNVDDALEINKELLERAKKQPKINVVVVGGGYTGIEVATNIYHLLNKNGKEHRITILEKGADILMMVPEWLRKECRKELDRIGITVVANDSLKSYDGQKAFFGSGKVLENAFCVWSAGVRTTRFLDGIKAERIRTRIKVDKNLEINGSGRGNVFITGDNAAFSYTDSGESLRMAVMFSMGQGKIAAENVVRSIFKRPSRKYKAVDLGYLIPFATGKAPGIIMGKRINGNTGYFMHYFMCLYRSGWGNRFKMLEYWLKGGRCGNC
ncbi:MAG: FAD-dependent oxidoreductase [Candidatus Omnitrophota bacterium]|jgi:NADH dehydrogenase